MRVCVCKRNINIVVGKYDESGETNYTWAREYDIVALDRRRRDAFIERIVRIGFESSCTTFNAVDVQITISCATLDIAYDYGVQRIPIHDP